MLSARARWLSALALATVASGALAYPARVFDMLRFHCGDPRAPNETAVPAAFVALLIALLAIAWTMAVRAAGDRESRMSLRFVIAASALPHFAALASMPFLSKDVLYYAAIGRVISRYGENPYRHLGDTMRHDDPFWNALPAMWHYGTSAYFPGFHVICRGVSAIARGDLTLAIKLHQLIGLACMLGAAALAAMATRDAIDRDLDVTRPFAELLGSRDTAKRSEISARAAAVVATVVALCPLGIIDATNSAHNDGWIALGSAAVAFFVVRGSIRNACATLAMIALIKPTALLFAVTSLVAIVCDQLRKHRKFSSKTIRSVTAIAAVLAVCAFTISLPLIRRFTESFDLTHAPMVTESSLEMIPRTLLFAAGDRSAALTLGVDLRALGLIWIATLVTGTLADGRVLPRVATAIFGFYIFFSGYSHSWYLLAIVPLLPFADPKWQRAMAASIVTLPLGYASLMYFQCGYPQDSAVWMIAAITQAAIANGIPLALRYVDRARGVA